MEPIVEINAITRLSEIGVFWHQKNGPSRIYFNDATLRGETISTRKGNDVLWILEGKGQLWFDLADGRFYSQGLNQEQTDSLVAAICASASDEPPRPGASLAQTHAGDDDEHD